MKINELYSRLDSLIPRTLSCVWDNDGLVVCPDTCREVGKALISLDCTDEAVAYAAKHGFDVIITHHPPIFKPLGALTSESAVCRRVFACAEAGISVMSFHTRLDALDGGVNDIAAGLIGLVGTEPFALPGEPPTGRLGFLPAELTFEAFAGLVRSAFGSQRITAVKASDTVHRVALVCGGGKDFIGAAIAKGADTLLTGEANYNSLIDARDGGLNVFCAGHYETEAPVCGFLADTVAKITGVYTEIYRNNYLLEI